MDSCKEELLKTIRYYQESLDRYTLNKNNYKLLSIIEKLKKLPIATSHLEDTGIGRTVNALRKLGGNVGDAAKCLVAKWKEMVVQEEVKAKENTVNESANVAYSSENEFENDEERENTDGGSKPKEIESNTSHKSSDTEERSSENYKIESSKYPNSSRRERHHDKKDRKKDRYSTPQKSKQGRDNGSDDGRSKKDDSSTCESDDEVSEKEKRSKSKRRHKIESSEDEENPKRKSKKLKHSKDSSDSENNHRKHKSRSSKSSRDDDHSKSKLKEKTETKTPHYDSLSDRELNSKPESNNKSKRNLSCEDEKSPKRKSHKCDFSPNNKETKSKSKYESKSRHEKDSPRESKVHSSRSEKPERSDRKDNKREESKEKQNHKKDESRKQYDKYKNIKDEKENGKKEKSSISNRLEENEKTDSKHKSNSGQKHKNKSKTEPVNNEKIMNGIDSGSGASFAEALGMCGSLVSSKSSTSTKKKSSVLPVSEKPKSSTSYAKSEKTDVFEEENIPTLLKEQPPEPLNINISSLLPEITPHYRPLGFTIDPQPKRLLTQDEALSQVISNKNMRTKVYSGNKSHGKVESLFDLCVKILQDNIDALEYTGGVPYSILKPILDKATPDQLFNMEHHNPYLIEDTDELWHLHCQKEFRNKKREELESWREMYMRCLDEREAKLNAITANIKHSQDKSTPVRTTKLAYMDSVVKPPRNIARKQAKNGIIVRPTQTPSSRISALAASGEAGKTAVPNPGIRAVDRSSSSNSATLIKPKKAPLMAKTLSLFKNRFRR